MPEIFFKFDIGDKVITKFGETGFIDNLCVTRGGRMYYVETALGKGGYMMEKDLEMPPERPDKRFSPFGPYCDEEKPSINESEQKGE
jgi:hypothetical protein